MYVHAFLLRLSFFYQNIFDAIRKVFVADEETSRMTLIDKSDLFFHDYNFTPLFVHENYIRVKPRSAG